MTLSLEIQQLRDSHLEELDHCLRYVRDTEYAWLILQQLATQRKAISIRDQPTKQPRNLSELVARAEHYTTVYLAESALERIVAIFEDFFFELLRLWLLEHPRSLEKKQLEFSTVLDATDITSIKSAVIERELLDLKYQRVEKWFRFLQERIGIALPVEGVIEMFVEMKARRDVITHSRGIVTGIYMQKVGTNAKYSLGERIEVTDSYLDNSSTTLKGLIAQLANATLTRASI